MKVEEVEEQVAYWLNQFSGSTRRGYREGLALFLDFLDETMGGTWTPKKLVEEREKDLKNRKFVFEQKVCDFFAWLKNYVTKPTEIDVKRRSKTGKISSYTITKKGNKKYSDNTRQAFVSSVRSFLAHHRLDLKLTTQQKRLLGKRPRLVKQDHRLSLQDVEKMAEVGTPQERFILLAGKDLGLRAIDFKNLRQGAFARVIDQNQNGEPPYFLGEVYTQKEGVNAYPFLTVDGLEVARVWLQLLKTKGLRDDNAPMLQIRKKELTQNLRRMAKKAGIKTHGRRIRFHCLRKFLIDRISIRMSESKWKQIVGKQIDEGAYVSPFELKEGYAAVLDRIQLPKTAPLNHERIETVEKKLQEKSREIEKLRTEFEDMKTMLQESVKQTVAQRLLFLREKGAPKEILRIGEKMLRGENVSFEDSKKFYDWGFGVIAAFEKETAKSL